jgi:hypothetical protein
VYALSATKHGARVRLHHRAGRGRHVAPRGGHQFRKPEIQHFDEAVGPAHHVLGLEIAVHDTGGMCGAHRRGDLDADVEGLAHGEVPQQPMAQCLAIDVLHRDELLAVRPFAQRVNRADVRMIESGGGSRPLFRTREGLVGWVYEFFRTTPSDALRAAATAGVRAVLHRSTACSSANHR